MSMGKQYWQVLYYKYKGLHNYKNKVGVYLVPEVPVSQARKLVV
jgi:hypothetical protein